MFRRLLVCCALVLIPAAGFAQELWPGTRYDAKIPTLKAVLGWDFGERITPPDGIAAGSIIGVRPR